MSKESDEARPNDGIHSCLNTADWQLHPETLEISKIQQLHKGQDKDSEEEIELSNESEEEGSQNQSDGENSDDSAGQPASLNPFALLADEDD